MRTGQPLGLSADGKELIVVLDDSEQISIPADERLRAAIRRDRPRLGQLEIDMDSALRPRDIQARIRSGASLEDVAQAAGVPVERVEPFAAPVIAEREHVCGLAQSQPVRRTGESVAHRSLRSAVTERLLSRGIDSDVLRWDAWKREDRKWIVRVSYDSGEAHRKADFIYDQTGRFSVADNEDARWLLGEHSSSHGPQPGRRPRHGVDTDPEQTLDLNDDLALVRAIQPREDETDTPDNEDAFTGAQLREVDGMYDIVPNDPTNLDVLYDMLASFDEDSVQIYAGLVKPAMDDETASPVLDEERSPGLAPAGAEEDLEPTVVQDLSDFEHEDDTEAADEPFAEAAPEAEPAPAQPISAAVAQPEPVVTEPEQPSLVEELPDEASENADAPAPPPPKPPARKGRKKKRASVPSWDEIMFGAPTTPKKE